jgi:flavin-dependent dehydrogenase
MSDDGLHFYYDPHHLKRRRIGWLFPIDGKSRAGIGSYRGESQLRRALEDFVRREFDGSPASWHGGFFPYRQQPPTTGPVFRVGDAAGQCFPLTGEGIRPALYYGAVVGRLARRVLAGEMSHRQAPEEYRRWVRRRAQAHRWLLAGPQVIPDLPVPGRGRHRHGAAHPGDGLRPG